MWPASGYAGVTASLKVATHRAGIPVIAVSVFSVRRGKRSGLHAGVERCVRDAAQGEHMTCAKPPRLIQIDQNSLRLNVSSPARFQLMTKNGAFEYHGFFQYQT
jgi:hypothetical protein